MSAESRDRFVAALREAADLYENHPQLPVPTVPVRISAAPVRVSREDCAAALRVAVHATGHQPTIDMANRTAEVKIAERVILAFDLDKVGELQSVTRERVEYVLPTAVTA